MPLIRNPKVRRVGVLAVLAAWAAVAMPGAVVGRQPPAALPPSAYLDDFDSAWTFIRDNYAYFEEKSVDWEQVRNLLRPRATAIRDGLAVSPRGVPAGVGGPGRITADGRVPG